MKVSAIITGGGTGRRMNNAKNKLFIKILGRTILEFTLAAFESVDLIDDIILTIAAADLKKAEAIVKKSNFKKVRNIVSGGKTRQDSVYRGLQKVENDTDIVVVHDAARPCITKGIIIDSIKEAGMHGAVIVGMPVKDTIKTIGDDRLVANTLDRELLWQVQTPQVFKYLILKKAYENAGKSMISATDDSRLVELTGEKVKIIEGSYENIKITTPDDLRIAEVILKSR